MNYLEASERVLGITRDRTIYSKTCRSGLTVISAESGFGKNTLMQGILFGLRPTARPVWIHTETNLCAKMHVLGIEQHEFINSTSDEELLSYVEDVLIKYDVEDEKSVTHLFIETPVGYCASSSEDIITFFKRLKDLCEFYSVNIFLGIHRRKGK